MRKPNSGDIALIVEKAIDALDAIGEGIATTIGIPEDEDIEEQLALIHGRIIKQIFKSYKKEKK